MMDRVHAVKLSQILLMKTTANGCTQAEATEAAEKLAEFMQRYRISLHEIMLGEMPAVKSAPAPSAPEPEETPHRVDPQTGRGAWHRFMSYALLGILLFRVIIYLWPG
jgi:hypothetical protein